MIEIPSRSQNKRIGFIAGCFDPFPHPGQIWAMQQAIEADACDSIVIALQVDPSIERPEKSRMYLSVDERLVMLNALKWTEYVVPYRFEEELVEVLKETEPDVRILGDDYRGRDFTGSELEIPIFWAKRRDDWSGTAFRNRIRNDEFIETPTATPKPGEVTMS